MIEFALMLMSASLIFKGEPCETLERAEVQRLFELEPVHKVQDDIEARLRCEGSAVQLNVSAMNRQQASTAERRISLALIDTKARARLVVLALVEMIDRLVTKPPSPKATPTKVGARWSVTAQGKLLSFTSASAPLFGGGAVLTLWPSGSWWGGRLEFDAASGGRTVEEGRLRMTLFSGGLSAVAGGQVGALWLEGDIGSRLGAARLVGAAQDRALFDEGEVSGVFSGVFVGGGVQLMLTDWLRGGLRAEAGVVTLPVIGTVDSQAALSANGFWVSGAVSLGVVFFPGERVPASAN